MVQAIKAGWNPLQIPEQGNYTLVPKKYRTEGYNKWVNDIINNQELIEAFMSDGSEEDNELLLRLLIEEPDWDPELAIIPEEYRTTTFKEWLAREKEKEDKGYDALQQNAQKFRNLTEQKINNNNKLALIEDINRNKELMGIISEEAVPTTTQLQEIAACLQTSLDGVIDKDAEVIFPLSCFNCFMYPTVGMFPPKINPACTKCLDEASVLGKIVFDAATSVDMNTLSKIKGCVPEEFLEKDWFKL